MKQEGEAFVKAEVTKAMMQNPSMTAAQQKQVTKQAQQAFQAQAQAKLIQEIKNKQ